MNRWGIGIVLALTVVPAAAQCTGDASCSERSPVGELQRLAAELRWELHELDYSELATNQERQAKRDELRRVCDRLELAKRDERAGWLRLAASVARPPAPAVEVAAAPAAPR